MGARLITLTSGRSMVLPARTAKVRTAASAGRPTPLSAPTAAEPPQRRGCIQAPDMCALLHDDAGAEEADAGNDVGRDLRRAGIAIEVHAKRDERGGADGDQHIGAQSGAALPPLPLRADQRSQHERDDDANAEIEQMAEVEVGDERHALALSTDRRDLF